MIGPACLSQGLERVFIRIQQQRMQDVPVQNPKLQVQAVGFIHWQEQCLGVLITPWFMNLMLLPGEGDEWGQLSVGEKVSHQFPSGPYEFIVGDEAGIGRYQMCSLFSPMFQFIDQPAAVATAEAVMQALMDEANGDGISMQEREIARRWHGEPADAQAQLDEPSLGQRLEHPISRRDLLRGRILHDP